MDAVDQNNKSFSSTALYHDDYSDTSEKRLEEGTKIERDDGQLETSKFRMFLGHASFITILAIVWLGLTNFYGRPSAYGVSLIKSPARSAVRYERVLLNGTAAPNNELEGRPGSEVDKFWDDLLEYQYLAVPQQDLPEKGGVTINDGTNRAIISLQVFDSLHCINLLRTMVFREHYDVKRTMQQQIKAVDCINTVRQAIMCYADISFSTFTWEKDRLLPWPHFEVEKECRNWNSIMQWAERHKAPQLEGELLMHPLYGPVSIEDLRR